jgi:uncharacterized protein involved in tolerance to divalent cations
VRGFIFAFLLSSVAFAQGLDDQKDSLRAQAEREVLKGQEKTIARIVQGVARGVLDLPPGVELSHEQEETIERITRSLVKDVAVFREAELSQKGHSKQRSELVRRIVLNLGKAIAIVIALLVLRAIIGAIGRGVAAEDPGATMNVFITAASEEEAEGIGRDLIGDHLAARGTIASPVREIARKGDRVEEFVGVLLALKTTQANVPAIIGHVVERTNAPVPEIVALPHAPGQDPDLDWVRKSDPQPWWKRILRPGGRRT